MTLEIFRMDGNLPEDIDRLKGSEKTCAPPVGHYTIPDMKTVNLASFQKSERWNKEKDLKVNNSIDNSTISNKSILPILQSSSKKKNVKTKSFVKTELDDTCRKSLEADVEFQQSKINALLEKIQSLEHEVLESKSHSESIESSNTKLHNILDDLRKEKSSTEIEKGFLEERLLKLNAEHKILLESYNSGLVVLDDLKSKMIAAEQKYEERILELTEKLSISQELNCDFREQLESVESAMTQSLRDLTGKYECLEQTLDHVQTDYNNRLQRSNSLVEKTKTAYDNCQTDLETMNTVYNQLKVDYENLIVKDEEIQNDMNQLQNTISLLQDSERTLKDQLKALMEEKNRIKQELTDSFQNISVQFEAEKKYTQEWKQKYETASGETVQLSEDNKNLETQINSLNKIHEELREQVTMSAKLVEEKNTENHGLSEDKKNLETQIVSLNKIHEELREQVTMSAKLVEEKNTENHGTGNEMRIRELEEELSLWQAKYGDLERKVSPFMCQLNEFENERQILLSANAFTQQEMTKLSEKYAQILGHQNNKQKIHHIRKLKEENLSLKSEVMKLRTMSSKDKLKLSQLEASTRKFDRTKAFSHVDKENAKKPLQPHNT